MKVEIKDVPMFQNIIDILLKVKDEITFKFTPVGVKIVTTDPANVCASFMFIKREFFSMYELDDEEKVTINIIPIKKILKGVTSIVLETNGTKLIVKTDKRTVSLGTYDDDNVPVNQPTIDFKTQLLINPADMLASLDMVDVFSSSPEMIKFEYIDNILTVTAKNDSNKADHTPDVKQTKDNVPFLSMFSYDYLKKLFHKGFKECIVYAGTDLPVKVQYNEENIMIELFLAPRVDNND